jgi:adenylosuccinate lyase
VCRELGLEAAPVSTQIVQRDRHAEFSAMLAIAAASLEKIALEVRGLQRTEVLEAQEPFGEGQKGSSAMPHKRNPELAERICGLARLVRTNALAALENVALWHERDISHSSVERVILPGLDDRARLSLHLTTFIVEGLEVDAARMVENLELSYGLVYSQRVLLKLTDAVYRARPPTRSCSVTRCAPGRSGALLRAAGGRSEGDGPSVGRRAQGLLRPAFFLRTSTPSSNVWGSPVTARGRCP